MKHPFTKRSLALLLVLAMLCTAMIGVSVAIADGAEDMTFPYTSEDGATVVTTTFHPGTGTVTMQGTIAGIYAVDFETVYVNDEGKLSIREIPEATAKMLQPLMDAGFGMFLPTEITASVFYETTKDENGLTIRMLFGDPAGSSEPSNFANITISPAQLEVLLANAKKLEELAALTYATEADGEDGTQSVGTLHFFNNGTYKADGILGGLYAWNGKGNWSVDANGVPQLSDLKNVSLTLQDGMEAFADALVLKKAYTASQMRLLSIPTENGVTLKPILSIVDAGGRLPLALSESLHPSRMDRHEILSIMERQKTIVPVEVGSFTLTEEDAQKLGFSLKEMNVVPATELGLNKTRLAPSIGETLALVPAFAPENAAAQQVYYESSNPYFATVDAFGNVTGMEPGYVRITAKTESGLTAVCEVIVQEKKAGVGGGEKASLSGVIVSKEDGENNLSFDADGTVAINSAADLGGGWVWSFAGKSGYSFNGDQLVIHNATGTATDPSGLLQMIAGTSTIPAPINFAVSMTEDGGATVTVSSESEGNPIALNSYTLTKDEVELLKQAAGGLASATGVTLDSATLELVKGNNATLTATVEPSNAANKQVTWSSDNEAVATVSEGVVTAVEAGTATITATTEDGGFTASCTVTVKDIPVTGIALDQTALTIEPLAADWTNADKAAAILTATVLPEDAGNKNVTWTSSDEAVATVTGGLVAGVSEGKAIITATTEDGGFTATCTVTVKVPEPVEEPDPSDEPKTGNLTIGGISFTHNDFPFAQQTPITVQYTREGETVTLTSGTATFFSENGKALYLMFGMDDATATASATLTDATVTLTYADGAISAHIHGTLTGTELDYDADAPISAALSQFDGSDVTLG